MPVKIRLTRQGRKKRSYYHIIVADSRAPRDGRFIENLGNYDPNTNPATIELDFEKSLNWVLKGAQPTDTCRAILSYKGVMYKKHLLEGVKKNAFSEEEAEKKFAAWLTEKEAKIQAKRDSIIQSKGEMNKTRLEAEAKANEKRAQEIAKKLAKLAAKQAGEEALEEVTEIPAPDETPVVAKPVAEVAAEIPVPDITPVVSEPVAEIAAEVPVPDVTPVVSEPVAEIAAEVPVPDEIPTTESPVAEETSAEDAKAKVKAKGKAKGKAKESEA